MADSMNVSGQVLANATLVAHPAAIPPSSCNPVDYGGRAPPVDLRPAAITVTPAMIEAGEDVMLCHVGDADLGRFFCAADLALLVFEAMKRVEPSSDVINTAENAALRERVAMLEADLLTATRVLLRVDADDPKGVNEHVDAIVKDLKEGLVGTGDRRKIGDAVKDADRDAAAGRAIKGVGR